MFIANIIVSFKIFIPLFESCLFKEMINWHRHLGSVVEKKQGPPTHLHPPLTFAFLHFFHLKYDMLEVIQVLEKMTWNIWKTFEKNA